MTSSNAPAHRACACEMAGCLGAKLVHVALYVMMIGMPLLGWLSVGAKGDAVPFFGWQLPRHQGQHLASDAARA